MQPVVNASAASVFVGGGEMGALMRAFDWSQTPLGPVEGWPQNLKAAVRLMLNSRYPMFIWWGDALTILYNDGYAPIFGRKHPAALGQSARQVWAEIWDDLVAQVDAVMHSGLASWNEEVLLFMERNGFPEEVYFTWSYSPIFDDAGKVGGLFCACTEDTRRVLGERRLNTLRDLGERSLAEAKSPEQACRAAAAALASNPHDFPFALIYLLDEGSRQARLAEGVNLPASPAAIELGSEGDVWNFQGVLETSQSQVVEDLEARFGRLPAGPWADDWTRRAFVLPLARAGGHPERPAGFLVAGLSPRLAFNEDYRSFLGLAAGQLATAIANARTYEDERRRAEALAELDRAKTAFFSNVSHEFRTPLTLMLGPLEEMLTASTGGLPTHHQEQLAIAHRNGLRLLKLVNTLLDFSRIEAGRLQASYEPIDLAAFTADLVSVFRSAIERAGLRLIVDCPPLPDPVFVDRDMWEKIVLNLLSNALKFTFEGEIAVRLRRSGDVITMQVSDTGIGIPADALPNLFTRFYRIRGAQARTHEGTGIGLAFVHELVRLHDGTIQVASEPGRGSTFTVSIPAGSAHLPADRLAAGHTRPSTAVGAASYVEEALRWLPTELEDVNGSGAGQPSPGLRPEPAVQARVLVVDDNADMRDYLRRLLGQHWSVETVGDGAAALARIREAVPDLVLSDVMMPGLSGFDLLQAVRADPRARAVPVVLLSARAGKEAQVEGLEAGADDYVLKPFLARELIARIGTQLEMARLRRELLGQTQARAEQLRLLTNALPVLISYVDAQHRYQFNNYGYQDWFGLAPESLHGQHLRDALGEDAYAALLPYMETVLSGQTVSFEAEVPYLHGGLRPVLATYVPHTVASGETLGFFALVTDITERRRAEQALRESEGRYRFIVENTSDGIWQIELTEPMPISLPEDEQLEWYYGHAVIRQCNLGLARMYGYSSAEDVTGLPLRTVMPRENPINLDLVRRFIRAGYRLVDAESYELDRDGRPVVFLNNMIGILEDGKLKGEWGTNRDITERKQIEYERAQHARQLEARVRERTAELEQSRTQLQDLSTRIEALREEERTRIAREIHDELGQQLTGLKMDLARLRKGAEQADPGRPAHIAELSQAVDDTIKTVRRMATELRPAILDDLGLIPAIEWQCQEFTRRSGIRCRVEAQPADVMLERETATGAFRVVQETLTNVARHAQATEVEVSLQQHEDALVLRVRDNGRGISETQLRHPRSLGLLGMRERVRLFGGELAIEGAPGAGTTVVVRIPMQSQPHDSPGPAGGPGREPAA